MKIQAGYDFSGEKKMQRRRVWLGWMNKTENNGLMGGLYSPPLSLSSNGGYDIRN